MYSRTLLLLALLSFLAGTSPSSEQSSGTFTTGQTLTAAQLNAALAAKLDFNGVTVTGVPAPGNVLVASDASDAAWGSLAANTVANSSLAQMVANTVKCNNTGSTANAADCQTIILSGNVFAQNISRLSVTAKAVNFNAGNTDTSITVTMPPTITTYVVNTIRIANASASISTATGGVFTAAAGGGVAIASNQALTVTTGAANTNNNTETMTQTTPTTQSYNVGTLFFRVGTAQGSAATADVILELVPLP